MAFTGSKWFVSPNHVYVSALYIPSQRHHQCSRITVAFIRYTFSFPFQGARQTEATVSLQTLPPLLSHLRRGEISGLSACAVSELPRKLPVHRFGKWISYTFSFPFQGTRLTEATVSLPPLMSRLRRGKLYGLSTCAVSELPRKPPVHRFGKWISYTFSFPFQGTQPTEATVSLPPLLLHLCRGKLSGLSACAVSELPRKPPVHRFGKWISYTFSFPFQGTRLTEATVSLPPLLSRLRRGKLARETACPSLL